MKLRRVCLVCRDVSSNTLTGFDAHYCPVAFSTLTLSMIWCVRGAQ